ncbi:PIN domain-containing protein [Angustibacter speluncae]
MIAEPRPGRTIVEVTKALRDCHVALVNFRGAGPPMGLLRRTWLSNYQRIVTAQLSVLRLLVTQDSIDRLLTGRQYFFLRSIDPHTGGDTSDLVHLEVAERIDVLEAAIQEHTAFTGRWSQNRGAAFVVPDTNVLLHHPRSWTDVDWHQLANPQASRVDLVLPLLLLDELDNIKNRARGQGNRTTAGGLGTRARDALREIEKRFDGAVDRPAIITKEVDAHLLLDEPGHVRLPHADDELVFYARRLRELTGRIVTLVTYDTGCLVRAQAAKLRARRPEQPEPLSPTP